MKFQQKNRCDWYLQNHSIILKAKTSFIKRLRLITKSGRFKKEKQNISANYRQLLNRFSISFYFRSQRFCECYFCNFYGKIKFVFRRIFFARNRKRKYASKNILTSLPLSLALSLSNTLSNGDVSPNFKGGTARALWYGISNQASSPSHPVQYSFSVVFSRDTTSISSCLRYQH